MSEAAGNVSVVLSVNKANFTAAMVDAQRQLDAFAGKTREAGHSTVSSMQAASASIRELNGDFSNNVRAVERFITTIPGVGKALQAAFPLVGGLAFGAMIAKSGQEVKEFIDAVNKMPKAIEQGFVSMGLSAASSIDQLRLVNDTLQNNIDRLQGKQQNNLAIQLDEARVKADELAKSLQNDAKEFASLLAQNKISALGGILTNQSGTASISSSATYGMNEIAQLGKVNANAVRNFGPDSPQAQKSLADLKAKQDYYSNWITSKLFLVDNPQYAVDSDQIGGGDQAANRNILLGMRGVIGDQQDSQAEQARNGQLAAQNKAAEASKVAMEAAAKARRQAAEEFMRSLRSDGEVAKQWTEYENKNNKILSDWTLEKYKSSGLSSDDSKQISQSGSDQSARIAALRQSIDLQKQNSQAIAESALQMAVATGQMSKLDAARVSANMHQQEYADTLKQLQEQAAYIQTDKQYDGREAARQAALQDNASQQAKVTAQYQMQTAQDNQGAQLSSSSVGFKDALDSFVDASRDAATQMRDLTTNTLQGLNGQIVGALSGQKTNFSNFGAGVFRDVAGIGLSKAEGSVLGMFGLGSGSKLGTAGNPMIVKFADGVSSAVGSAGGFLKGLFGGSGPGASGLASALGLSRKAAASDSAGGGIGLIGSTLSDLLPSLGLATGGTADANSTYLVGEKGPEILTMGNQPGRVTPNSQIGGGVGHTFYIDATNSHDPAATEAAVQRGIAAATPHIVAQSVKSVSATNARKPSSRR